MKIFTLTKTVTHPRMKSPLVQTVQLEARDLNHAVTKRLKLSGSEKYDLRKHQTTSHVDHRGGTITLTIKEDETCQNQPKPQL